MTSLTAATCTLDICLDDSDIAEDGTSRIQWARVDLDHPALKLPLSVTAPTIPEALDTLVQRIMTTRELAQHRKTIRSHIDIYRRRHLGMPAEKQRRVRA